MEILIDGKVYQAEPDTNGKVKVTFTKQNNSEIEVRPLANCQGTTLLDNIQIEKNSTPTAYEEPSLIMGESTGLIKDIRDVQYALNEPRNGVYSKITQLTNSISLKVSNRDLLSQINIQANGILIQSGTNKLNVTPDTTYIENGTIKSAMIKDLSVDKIIGTNAQFTTMITKGLTADVISSNMINANEALFDKLFSNSMATTKLAAQTAWIKNANIASLDASKIKTGTIDAARLNAKKIVADGLEANVIKSEHINSTVALVNKLFSEDAYVRALTAKTAFISSIQAIDIDADKITAGIASKTGNRVTITNTGMKVTDSKFETEFINGGPSFFTKTSTGRAFMGEIGDMTSAGDGSKALGIKGAYNVPVVLGVQAKPTDTTYTGKVIVHRQGVAIFDRLQVEGDIYFTENGKESIKNIAGVDKLWFQGQSYITSTAIMGVDGKSLPDTSGWINLQAQWGTNLWYQNRKKARQYGNKFQFWCNIEPQAGYSVSGSSDARLKHNIADVKESSLEKLEKIQFKHFTWNSNNKDDFGFIAQEVINIIPEIIEESEDGYYRYNSTRFSMIVAHATKELNDKVKFLENKIERLERIIDGN